MHPVLFRIGGYDFPAYAALLTLAGVVSVLCLRRLSSRMGLRTRGEFWLLINVLILSCFVGGRGLALLLQSAGGSSAWAVAFDSSEGLATFGVLAGVVAGIWAYCFWTGVDRRAVLDGVFLVVPLGHGIARLGCFMAGCCQGKPAPAWLPWTVRFTDARSEVPAALLGVPLHPVQLYEAAGDFVLAICLYQMVRPRVWRGELPPGMIAAGYFAGYGILRFIDEFFRADAVACPGTGLSVEQVFSLGAILVAGVAGCAMLRQVSRSLPPAQSSDPAAGL